MYPPPKLLSQNIRYNDRISDFLLVEASSFKASEKLFFYKNRRFSHSIDAQTTFDTII